MKTDPAACGCGQPVPISPAELAVIGLPLPEIIILHKVLKWPLTGVFVGVVTAGIIITGYLLNAIL